jgi:hypothetical protein
VVLTNPADAGRKDRRPSRIVIAWPAGNSGIGLFFEPVEKSVSTMRIALMNSSTGYPIAPEYISTKETPRVGVTGLLSIDRKSTITLAILGSVRAIRDYTEGTGRPNPIMQKDVKARLKEDNTLHISRLWFDGNTEMSVRLSPASSNSIRLEGNKAILETGEYTISAHFNYPQLHRLSTEQVLKNSSQFLARQQEVDALTFLSYSEKLVAGAWRFMTYFGRDAMISTLLLQPVLTHTATEAVLGSVLERINRTDGSTCHEEIIGDYATFLNLQDGFNSTAARCDYSMVDTDFFLPILLHAYFVESGAEESRLEGLFSTAAGKVEVKNKGLNWGDLFELLVKKIMVTAAPFASPGGRRQENLIRLKEGHETGTWRDSIYGLGGGRVPFDVNVALIPAALRSIAALGRKFGDKIFENQWQELSTLADQYAEVWEDYTLDFFRLDVPAKVAQERLDDFARTNRFYDGPSHAELVDSNIIYYALALEGPNGLDKLPILHTDACCRIYFVNGTNHTRVTEYLNSTALSIIRPFPAGLRTPLGVVVANPALSGSKELIQNFTNSAYHGAVIWSWHHVAMARGLERQLARCDTAERPGFCNDQIVYGNVKKAYNMLWDVIEETSEYLSDELWTWTYDDQEYHHAALSDLPPPPGVERPAESNAIQLWSLTFLAVERNVNF